MLRIRQLCLGNNYHYQKFSILKKAKIITDVEKKAKVKILTDIARA